LNPAATAAFCDLTSVDTLMGGYAMPKTLAVTRGQCYKTF
jgi:hypothetical protein